MSTTVIVAVVGALLAAVLAVVVFKAALSLVWFVAVGLLVGALARWALPGRQEMGLFATTAYGMAGSLGGLLVAKLLHVGSIFEFALSIGCAAALVAVVSRNKQLPKP